MARRTYLVHFAVFNSVYSMIDKTLLRLIVVNNVKVIVVRLARLKTRSKIFGLKLHD